MKKGDIVKFVGETGQYYSQNRPPFLENAIGKVKGKEFSYKVISQVKRYVKYNITFLFEVNVEKRYVSSFTELFKEEELQPATDEEKKRYYELEDIIKAKEIAEKL
jgi:hypothetical protein